MPELTRIWWRPEAIGWGPYPFAPQWQPLDVDPERLEEVLVDMKAERLIVYTEEEFQQNLAFAFWADEQELRRLSRFDLEAELEFISRQLHEIRVDESLEGAIFKPLLIEGYETRQNKFSRELDRRAASDTLERGSFVGPFPRDFPGRLKDDVALPDFLMRHYGLLLKRTGSIDRCLCPFHTEKTPSFVVWRDHYRCFGCGVSGDVFTYVQSAGNLGFVEAVLQVARMAGVSVPQPKESIPERDLYST